MDGWLDVAACESLRDLSQQRRKHHDCAVQKAAGDRRQPSEGHKNTPQTASPAVLDRDSYLCQSRMLGMC